MAKRTAKPETKSDAQPNEATHNLPAITTASSAIVMPLVAGDGIVEALNSYKNLQASLDRAMPDQMMEIRGRPYRKKGYWRAIRTAFGLNVEAVNEKRIEVEGGDWGYTVTYRATAPSGHMADGDGCCMASEKTDRQGRIIATEHNVRSHAHTRAFNRAVSNLVGFGEVSAEEVDEDRAQPSSKNPFFQKQPAQSRPQPTSQPKPAELSKFHLQLKTEIEDFVRDHELSQQDKADILQAVTAYEAYEKQDGSHVNAFSGVTGFDFSKMSEKMAQLALHRFHEKKTEVEGKMEQGGK